MSVPTDPAAELPAPPPAISFSLLRHAVGAPFLYAIVFPLAALDVLVSLYQAVCFRLWRLPRVARRGHFRMDRHKLTYLTPLQRFNCMYCSYANGVLAFATEVASRTEQYWCPIQHETTPAAPHKRYADFIAYGDQHALKARWRRLRDDLAKQEE